MTTQNLPIVDYQNPLNTARKKSSSGLTTILLLGGLVVLIVIFALPSCGCASKERANRVKCASNLRQIGQAIQLYVADQKSLPDTWTKLVTSCDLSTEVFVCPSSDASAAPATDPSKLTTEKGHNSYIFLFENQPLEFLKDADRILAYENPLNHDKEGSNVLYADGHVDWHIKQSMDHMISELNAGFNPPRKIQQPAGHVAGQ